MSTSGQLNDLPSVTHYLTGHDASGKSVVEEARPAQWKPFDDNAMAFNLVFTTTFPADLNENKDIKAHDALTESGKLGLVNPKGVVCRMVDLKPGYTCLMHRTQSIDFGIVLEGDIEMILDDGKTELVKKGSVVVQRATMHAWRNPSSTNWTRMCFILQDSQLLKIGEKHYGEDLGSGTEGLPPSGND